MLTGCDSTSCLKGIGKKKAFKVLKRKIKGFSKLKELGDKLELPNELIRTYESFICQLYEPDSKNNDINTLRNKTFCRNPKQNDLLPPCKNSVFQHLQRSNYQANVWKNALIPVLLLPRPVGYGWTKDRKTNKTMNYNQC